MVWIALWDHVCKCTTSDPRAYDLRMGCSTLSGEAVSDLQPICARAQHPLTTGGSFGSHPTCSREKVEFFHSEEESAMEQLVAALAHLAPGWAFERFPVDRAVRDGGSRASGRLKGALESMRRVSRAHH
jgi:hypothetical protein